SSAASSVLESAAFSRRTPIPAILRPLIEPASGASGRSALAPTGAVAARLSGHPCRADQGDPRPPPRKECAGRKRHGVGPLGRLDPSYIPEQRPGEFQLSYQALAVGGRNLELT